MSLLENGQQICACKKIKYVRHGKCTECIKHHKKSLPACKRYEKPKRERIR